MLVRAGIDSRYQSPPDRVMILSTPQAARRLTKHSIHVQDHVRVRLECEQGRRTNSTLPMPFQGAAKTQAAPSAIQQATQPFRPKPFTRCRSVVITDLRCVSSWPVLSQVWLYKYQLVSQGSSRIAFACSCWIAVAGGRWGGFWIRVVCTAVCHL